MALVLLDIGIGIAGHLLGIYGRGLGAPKGDPAASDKLICAMNIMDSWSIINMMSADECGQCLTRISDLIQQLYYTVLINQV